MSNPHKHDPSPFSGEKEQPEDAIAHVTCPKCKKRAHVVLIGNSGKASGKNSYLATFHTQTGSKYCVPRSREDDCFSDDERRIKEF